MRDDGSGATRSLAFPISAEFPKAEVLAASARTGTGLDEWFARIASAEQIARDTMPVDYALYGEGEALLGWLNATVALSGAGKEFDGNAALQALCHSLQRRLSEANAEVAHFKANAQLGRGAFGPRGGQPGP